MSKTKFHFYYTDSVNNQWTIEYELNEYLNLMTLIFDRGYEDWGDCRGRAWCGTCHIFIAESFETATDKDEIHTISHLPNKLAKSRLSCQIQLNKTLHQKHVHFLGDFAISNLKDSKDEK